MSQRPYTGLGPQKYAQASKSSSQGQSGVTFEPSKKKGTIGLGEDNPKNSEKPKNLTFFKIRILTWSQKTA
jgi:hypothetical protein